MHIKYTIIINDCKLRYCNYNIFLLIFTDDEDNKNKNIE